MTDFPFPAYLDIPPAWEAAAQRFLAQCGTFMVLGAPDTGKSSLCRYLVYRAYSFGAPAALIDLDAGQSHLGPPATLGLGLYPPLHPGDDTLFPQGLYFIGQTSPVGAIPEVTVGCRVLADLAQARGLTRMVVNTSGFIQGPGALRLKRAEAELLNPSLFLALQRNGELEPLLRGLGAGMAGEALASQGEAATYQDNAASTLHQVPEKDTISPGWQFLRLPVSARAVRRPAETRRLYREERFGLYFRRAEAQRLPRCSLVWEGWPWGRGRPLDAGELAPLSRTLGVAVLHGEDRGRHLTLLLAAEPAEPPAAARLHWLTWPALHLRLLGLLDGRRRTLGLGLILPGPWDPEALTLWTPVAAETLSRVRFVKAGKLHLSLKGQELTDV
jgi:polynucleotide 5'-hydroxyl-kinase GRC3/NOL9